MRPHFYIHILFFSIISLSSFAESHRPQDFLNGIKGSKNEGMQIYNHFCINCHAQKPLITLGAPRIGEEADWASRVKQGIEVLLKHTDEGFNAMPARGGCFECTDEQLALAIINMVPLKAKKDLLKGLGEHKKNIK